MIYARDCSAVVAESEGERSCEAGARWELVSPLGRLLVYAVCSAHRRDVVDRVLPDPVPPGWLWVDRRFGCTYLPHRGCLSSLGRRQTCYGAGCPSRVGCPLTGGPGRGRPRGPERRETVLDSLNAMTFHVY